MYSDSPLVEILLDTSFSHCFLIFFCHRTFPTRTPCLKASWYAAPLSAMPELSPISDKPPSSPIRVAPKAKCRRRIKNVFIDNRGFPDQSDEFDVLLHNIDGGPVLWKLRHPAPPLDEPDAQFTFPFSKELHGNRMRKDLDLSRLAPDLQQQIYVLIVKYWSVFDDRGVFTPVRNYECVINTSNA